jgi:hypothetical protein
MKLTGKYAGTIMKWMAQNMENGMVNLSNIKVSDIWKLKKSIL